jgi:hypothetical protein
MENFTETKIINLNSKDCIRNNSTFLSDVYFQFSGLLKDEDDILERYISIQNAQIPFSFYNINVYNNILKIQIGATTYTLTLIRGNYNATSLITEIQNQLTNNGITDITLGVSSTTGLLTITKTTGSFSLISSGSTIYEILGFVVGTNYTSVSQKIISPYPLNLLGTLRLKICSYEFSTNNIDFNLITLPIEVGNFGLIQYTNLTNIKATLNNVSLDGFDISIIDDNNNYVNFNNINWTMTLVLTIVRRRIMTSQNRFSDIIKSNTEINIEEGTQEVNQEVNNEENQQEPIQEEQFVTEEPLTDDLDLLLYNNRGNLF